MTQLKRRGPNCAEVQAAGVRVLFSYDQAIAVCWHGLYYRTREKMTPTSWEHLKTWLAEVGKEPAHALMIEQKELEQVAADHMPEAEPCQFCGEPTPRGWTCKNEDCPTFEEAR